MSFQILDIKRNGGVSGFPDPNLDKSGGLHATEGHVSLHITAEVWP